MLTPTLLADGNTFYPCGAVATANGTPNDPANSGSVLMADWLAPGGTPVYLTHVYLFAYQYGDQQVNGEWYDAAGNDTSVMGYLNGAPYTGTLDDVHHLDVAAPFVTQITPDGRPLHDAWSASHDRSFEPDSVPVTEIKVWTHCTAPAQASVFVSIEYRATP